MAMSSVIRNATFNFFDKIIQFIQFITNIKNNWIWDKWASYYDDKTLALKKTQKLIKVAIKASMFLLYQSSPYHWSLSGFLIFSGSIEKYHDMKYRLSTGFSQWISSLSTKSRDTAICGHNRKVIKEWGLVNTDKVFLDFF